MKKALISLILIFALIFTFAACKGNGGDETTTATTTQEQTTASAAQNIENLLNALESNVNTSEGETSAALQPVEPDTMPEGTEVEVEKDENNKPKETLFKTYFQSVAKDKKFTMSANCSSTVDGMGMDIPLTMVRSGDKFYISMKAKISGAMTMDMAFIVNGEKSYMIIHNMKAYASTESGDNSFVDGLAGTEFGTMKYVKTTEITSDGKNYICEEYIADNGATYKCYFLKGSDKPERIESMLDGNVTVMKDLTFSNEADESVFEIPAGYRNVEGTANGF